VLDKKRHVFGLGKEKGGDGLKRLWQQKDQQFKKSENMKFF